MAVQFDVFAPDLMKAPLVALHVTMTEAEAEIPLHRHPSGQIILALRGAVMCQVSDALWMVPPGWAVWIPGNIEHRCQATINAEVCFLLVKPDAANLPNQTCTLEMSSLVRDLILLLANDLEVSDRSEAHMLDVMKVLVGELERLPIADLQLPIPSHPKLRSIVDVLTDNPADRRTVQQWGEYLAMSERTLARLIVRETGMSFGEWRAQLKLLIALRQLAAGATVQQISDDLGYQSTTAFITAFKKVMGVTPSKYFERR
ncbi:helix-turn-helix transcriptional regulator [Devosia sp. 2618]|uniref:AraC family transcriptional regulator n=1 Tax=Devosia sp. 2618 TaxID=3156454 RepID=UPI003391408D